MSLKSKSEKSLLLIAYNLKKSTNPSIQKLRMSKKISSRAFSHEKVNDLIEHPNIRAHCSIIYIDRVKSFRPRGCYTPSHPIFSPVCLILVTYLNMVLIDKRGWNFDKYFRCHPLSVHVAYREMKDFDVQWDGNSLSEIHEFEMMSLLYSYLINLVHVAHAFLIERFGDSPHCYYKNRNTWTKNLCIFHLLLSF